MLLIDIYSDGIGMTNLKKYRFFINEGELGYYETICSKMNDIYDEYINETRLFRNIGQDKIVYKLFETKINIIERFSKGFTNTEMFKLFKVYFTFEKFPYRIVR